MIFNVSTYRRLLYAAAGLCFLLILIGCVGVQPGTGSEVTIYYSGSLNGNLAGCDCWGYPVAGLAKKAYFLNHIPDRENALILDTGNLLEPGEDHLQAELLFESYSELGYDLIGIGPNDFSNGFDALIESRLKGRLESHNLRIRPSYEAEWQPQIVPQAPEDYIINGMKVEILALADPGLYNRYPEEFLNRTDILDPRNALKRTWTDLPAGVLRVVLLNGSRSTALKLAETGLVQLVFYTPEEESRLEVLPNGSICASAGLDGNSIGILKLRYAADELSIVDRRIELFDYLDSPADSRIQERADEYVRILRSRISGK